MTKDILFLVPGRLGDALMLSPALALLKQLKPEYMIDILGFDTLGNNVYVNNPNCNKIFRISEIHNFDIFFQSYEFIVSAHRDSRVMALLPRIGKPVVLIEPANQQEAQAQQALNFIQDVFSNRQRGHRTLAYQLFPNADDEKFISQFLSYEEKYVGFHLGCHGINKKVSIFPWLKKKKHPKTWPLENFIQLAQELSHRHPNYRIVLTGSDNEHHLAEEFMRYIPSVINLTGKTTNVLQLAALMRRLAAYICPDTGTMHVACAMNVPFVTLFGPTNMKRTGPYPAAAHRHYIQSSDLAKLNHLEVLQELEGLLL